MVRGGRKMVGHASEAMTKAVHPKRPGPCSPPDHYSDTKCCEDSDGCDSEPMPNGATVFAAVQALGAKLDNILAMSSRVQCAVRRPCEEECCGSDKQVEKDLTTMLRECNDLANAVVENLADTLQSLGVA